MVLCIRPPVNTEKRETNVFTLLVLEVHSISTADCTSEVLFLVTFERLETGQVQLFPVQGKYFFLYREENVSAKRRRKDKPVLSSSSVSGFRCKLCGRQMEKSREVEKALRGSGVGPTASTQSLPPESEISTAPRNGAENRNPKIRNSERNEARNRPRKRDDPTPPPPLLPFRLLLAAHPQSRLPKHAAIAREKPVPS